MRELGSTVYTQYMGSTTKLNIDVTGFPMISWCSFDRSLSLTTFIASTSPYFCQAFVTARCGYTVSRKAMALIRSLGSAGHPIMQAFSGVYSPSSLETSKRQFSPSNR